MIPKTVHQIWVGSEVPPHLAKMAERWQQVNPGWNYKLWRDDDLRWLRNQDLFDRAAEFAKPDGVGQMKSDIARYEILHRFGGVYMDMDMEPQKAMDPLMDVPGWAAFEEDGQWVANAAIAAEPGHFFMDRMIAAVVDSAKANKGKAVTWMTGPRVFTAEWNRLSSDEKQQFVVHPRKFFFPYSYLEFRDKSRPDPAMRAYPEAYAVHHWEHQRGLRGRPLVASGNGELSVAIMAHEKRAAWVPDLQVQLPGVTTVWDRRNDRWDTGARALTAHDGKSQWHMVVQDDALLPPDFYAGVKRMLTFVLPAHPVGLYYGRVRPRQQETYGLTVRASREKASFILHNGPWWGVGIVVPTKHTKDIVSWGDNNLHIPNYDRRISRWYNEQGIPCYYTVPSLIEHRTENNPSLVPGRTGQNRRAWEFVGPRSALEVDWSGPVVRGDM